MNDSNNKELSLLYLYDYETNVLKKYGKLSAITDLCILTGSIVYDCPEIDKIDKDNCLKGKTSSFWLGETTYIEVDTEPIEYYSTFYKHYVYFINEREFINTTIGSDRDKTIRPVLKSPEIFGQVYPNRTKGYNDTEEVEYGEYPQYVADLRMQAILETAYNKGMKRTGKTYTFDSTNCWKNDIEFKPITYDEYEYQGKKYIRIRANCSDSYSMLSNGVEYKIGNYVWVEVSPVKWLIDLKEKSLISKRGLVSGIRFWGDSNNCDSNKYKGFSESEIKEYLDRYMMHDLTQTMPLEQNTQMKLVRKNKYY